MRAGSGTGLALALDLGFIIAPASMVWENIGYFRSGPGSWHAMDPKWIRMELTFLRVLTCCACCVSFAFSFVFLNCFMCVCFLLLVFSVLCSSVIVVFVFVVCRLFFHLVFLVVFSVSLFVLCCWWSLFCCLLILCCLCLLCFVCVSFVFLSCVLCLSVCFLVFFVFCVCLFFLKSFRPCSK